MEVQTTTLIMPSASSPSSSPSSPPTNSHTNTASLSLHMSSPTQTDTITSTTCSSETLKQWSSSSPDVSLAITPENDPNPSWTFYPSAATYISSNTSAASDAGSASPLEPTLPSSPSRSPRSSSPPLSNSSDSNHTQLNGTSPSASSTPTTHHRILDHCFHLSIETRLKQAEAQYLASTQEQAVEDHGSEGSEEQRSVGQSQPDDWRRRQQVLVDEAVVLGRKGSNVEAIVDGILMSHRSSGPLQTLPRHLKHRLHLCQLTSMVFGRFDVASSTNSSAGLNIYSAFHSRRHGASRAAIKYRFSHSERGKQLQSAFSQPIPTSAYCRRHHRLDCKRTCCALAKLQQEQQQALELKKKMANNYFMSNSVRMTNHSKQDTHNHARVTGLVDAIPAFLKCSAMSYRDIAKAMVDKGEIKDMKDMKVLGGWYRLLLEMMTQAVIESYLCDEDTGFDTILDVFSYGDDPEDTEATLKNFTTEEDIVNPSTTPSSPSSCHSPSTPGVEGLHFPNISTSMPSIQNHYRQHPTPPLHDVTTQDRQDDILFAKTPEYMTFKIAKDERLHEFLTLNGTNMEQHFAGLAKKYPLIVFERQMTHFIARSQKLLVDPKLSQDAGEYQPMEVLIPPTTSAYADGSLSMPVSEDEDEEDANEDMESGRVKLEEIKEEDEGEDDETKAKTTTLRQPLSVVVTKEEKKSDGLDSQAMDEDDNSTAARVVQVSKKNRHHISTTITNTPDDAGHVAKKIKV